MGGNDEFKLQSYDWNEEWKRVHAVRHKPDDASHWDARAHSFDSDLGPSDYRNDFVRLADVRPGESVFDMGCGTGSLAIGYAQDGHDVVGADFSRGMLDEAMRRSDAQGVGTGSVRFVQMSWQDDWESHGIKPKSFDVAIASRSIATADIAESMGKLEAVARRICCITLSTGGNPRTDTRVLDACGIEHFEGRDYQYALNILMNKGIFPTCNYIVSTRIDSFDSKEDAIAHHRKMLETTVDECAAGLTDSQLERLESWLEDELVENEGFGRHDGHGGTQKRLRLAHPRLFHWAFISWSPR